MATKPGQTKNISARLRNKMQAFEPVKKSILLRAKAFEPEPASAKAATKKKAPITKPLPRGRAPIRTGRGRGKTRS